MSGASPPPGAVTRVGFVGLGRMGAPMAGHLVDAGFQVLVDDRDAAALAAFTARHGARAARDSAELGAHAQVLITMLPSGHDVQALVLGTPGEPGLIDALAEDAVVVDMGSSDPTHTRATGARLRARGLHMLDAPVAGGVVFARDATLDVLVGGEDAAIARCRPLFDAVGKQVHLCGGLGNGHAMKALNNYVNAAVFSVLVEALAVGRRLGLDIGVMTDALAAATTDRNHPLTKKVLPQVLTRRFDHGAALGLMSKDVRIARDAAREAEAWAPLAQCLSALWDEAEERFGTHSDQTESARLWEEHNGVVLERPDHDNKT